MKWMTLLMLSSFNMVLHGQTVLGTWKTVDDRDGAEKSYVEIYEDHGKVFGKITKLLKQPQDKTCDKCKGERKDKPLMNMVVIEALSKDKETFNGGRIFDPVSGNDYGCSIWIDPNKPDELRVRGKHWSGIYRTQTWFRVM
ncbi:MAG: DUF2147 domain-containing protein [Saprospiraceae bacterium]